MMVIETYARRGRHFLRRWALDPRVHSFLRGGGYFAAGFTLSAASLGQSLLPLPVALVCTCSGWSAGLSALGAVLGYRLFWGFGQQPLIWLIAALCTALLLGSRRLCRETPLLLPAIASLIIASTGVLFQNMGAEDAPIALFLVRIALAFGTTWLFARVHRGRNPVLEWLVCGLGVLALVQIAPVRWFSLGFFAAGILSTVGAFPAVAIAGLALDLARVTPMPMTAVLVLAYLVRLLPRVPGFLRRLAPGAMYLLVMWLCNTWDALPLPALLTGTLVGSFLPVPGKLPHRRGETGAAQVRLELAAGVLFQTQQLLAEATEIPIDEDALVTRAAERACATCVNRKNCKEQPQIAALPGSLLQSPLLQPEELPIVCRKSGRFLGELHRSQEQLRAIRADRQRQKEYRAAVMQQYGFLSDFLQDLSDGLSRRTERYAIFTPQITIYGNRPEEKNGDRCLHFPGIEGRYYILLCDGMGTGPGAVQEAGEAGSILRKLLCAGYPAEYALRSVNSLCALRNRAGAVTIDLAEIRLDTGKVHLYKWGAPPSYLMGGVGAERIGAATPPPGLSVTDQRETVDKFALRRDHYLIMVSDGVGENEALRCCMNSAGKSPTEIGAALLSAAHPNDQDDATVVIISLDTMEN